MKINLNGKIIETDATNISILISELKYNSDKIIVEHNKKIISKETWEKQEINENDKIEIISFVGGG